MIYREDGECRAVTLTTGADYADTTSSFRNNGLISSDFKFTSANETVNAGAGTLTGGDSLVDGSTTDADVLNATLTTGGLIFPTIQNIETLNLTSTIANSGLDFTNVLGAKTVTLTGTANTQLTSINGNAAPTIEVNNFNKVLTLNSATLAGTTAAGTAEALTVKISGMTAGGTAAAPVIPGITLTTTVPGAGSLETLNLESAGTSKNTVDLVLGANVNAVTKTVVTGAADLDLRVGHGLINGQTLDASGHTGTMNLIIDRNTAGAATTNLTNVKGYDSLTVRDSAAGGDNLVLSGVLSGSTVVVANPFAAAVANIGVKGAASGKNDTLTLVLDHSTDATDIDVNGANNLTIADVETLTIKSEGGTTAGNKIQQLDVTAGSAVVIDGSTKLDLGLVATSKVSSITIKGAGAHKVAFNAASAYAEGKNLDIDASEAAGKVTIDMTNFQGTAGGVLEKATITGSAQDDNITGSANANAKFVIDAGAGVDTVKVYTAAGGNTVTLGAGADKVTIDDVAGASAVIFTDFALGAGGDVLSVNTTAAMTLGGVGAAAVDNQLIILNASVANDAAAAAAVQGVIATSDEKAVILINDASGVAELWYFRDADAGADADAGETVKLATFENITTVGVLTDITSGFVAANFGTWA